MQVAMPMRLGHSESILFDSRLCPTRRGRAAGSSSIQRSIAADAIPLPKHFSKPPSPLLFSPIDVFIPKRRSFSQPSIPGGHFMNLTISGHHLDVSPALRNYVTTKLDRITRHFDQVVDVKVILTVENQKEKERRQKAECNIHVKGNDMFAESSHADLYAAVDDLVDKLDRQVVKHKDRLQNHHHEAPKRVM
jgi:putative sigma-54 modulation protein